MVLVGSLFKVCFIFQYIDMSFLVILIPYDDVLYFPFSCLDGLPQLCKFGKLNYLYLHTL